MYLYDSQELDSLLEHEDNGDEGGEMEAESIEPSPPPPPRCSQGHRSSLVLTTQHGGSICLVCFTSILTATPQSLTIDVSYALTQLSQALAHPPFLQSLLSFHTHLLVSPLVSALSSFDDEAIASQIIDLITRLCDSGGELVACEFVAGVSGLLCSRSLGWSRRQVYTLHCIGVLLNRWEDHIFASIKDTDALVCNLISGLQLPSDDIQGEILFVLYKLSVLEHLCGDGDQSDPFVRYSPKLIRLTLDALLKTQSDDVYLNCVALLLVLVQRGFLRDAYADDVCNLGSLEADSLIQVTDDAVDRSALCTLFSEAIKGPLLSANSQVQMSSLDLIFYYIDCNSVKQIQLLVEQNITDYVFEVLRSSEYKDPLVSSCLRILDLLSNAGQTFTLRLAVRFTTLVPVLAYVAEIPFHPGQYQILKLIYNCILNLPGVASASQSEQIALILARMLRRHSNGDMGMLSESFNVVCSILVSIMSFPTSKDISNLTACIQEASKDAISACLSRTEEYGNLILQSLHLLKEAFAYGCEDHQMNCSNGKELRDFVIDICRRWLLPWLQTINGVEEEIVLGTLEMFHFVLIHSHDDQTREFAENLISSSWLCFSFSCLALYPTERMKCRVYVMISSLIRVLLGDDCGEMIGDAASYLPSDPNDLLFLLGQQSAHNLQLSTCQSAVLQILYCSSLFEERLAADKLVLASIEQYILVNHSQLTSSSVGSSTIVQIVALYSLYRALAKMSYQMPYSQEAERLFIQMVTVSEWDLAVTRIHPTSLKWLFQQDKLCSQLSFQVLKFCRIRNSHDNSLIVYGKKVHCLDVQAIAELLAADDSYAAKLFVSLLEEVSKESTEEHDLHSVLNLLEDAIQILPEASSQLCLNGIGNSIYIIYYDPDPNSLEYLDTAIFVFNILSLVDSAALSDDGAWVSVARKVTVQTIPASLNLLDQATNWRELTIHCFVLTQWMDHLIQMGEIGKSSTCCLILGILSLVLHHSTKGALLEVSKTILLNTSFTQTLTSTIDVASANGPALYKNDEGTEAGEALILVLLLHYFALRSMHTILPGIMDWHYLLGQSNSTRSLRFFCIKCRDLSRLMYFGSPLVKLVASYSLLEFFKMLSEQREIKHEDLKCSNRYWMSMMSVLEGLLLFNDTRVAINCGLCLAMILSWEKLEVLVNTMDRTSMWCKLIVEELVMSLSGPTSVSKFTTDRCKSAVYVAIALLKLKNVPEWIRSVFDNVYLSGILRNLTSSNMNPELVLLCRELLNSDFLSAEHVANLYKVLQECRKSLYNDKIKDECEGKQLRRKVSTVRDDTHRIVKILIDLISSDSLLETYGGLKFGNERLLEEIEMFFTSSTVADDVLRRDRRDPSLLR